MPNLDWNKTMWFDEKRWEALSGGECWSVYWGSSYSQWISSIYPRISRFLPARNILEIAPGYGRWTKYLLPFSERFFGVDFSEKCIENCRERFAEFNNADFFVNDGKSLEVIKDGSIDFCFSFDSLVHVEVDIIYEYLLQIIKKLSANGVAFIHHSNLAEVLRDSSEGIKNGHSRAETVSCATVNEIIKNNGGKSLVQEKYNWSSDPENLDLVDGFTLFCRENSDLYKDSEYRLLLNTHCESEGFYSRGIINNYILP